MRNVLRLQVAMQVLDSKREQLLVGRGSIGNRLADETNAKRVAFARCTGRAVGLTADGAGFLNDEGENAARVIAWRLPCGE